jgi:hypothetical protein
MLIERRCLSPNQQGEPCRQAPLLDSDLCFWHDPRYEEEQNRARQLGGFRTRKEQTIQAAYNFGGITSVDDLVRLANITATDALTLENSVPRIRALTGLILAGAKLVELMTIHRRIDLLEQALAGRDGGRRRKR